jgi:hypothetical protein
LSFDSKGKGVGLRFYWKMSTHDENWLEIHISTPSDSYSCLVRHYGDVHDFLRFLKISSFGSKPNGLAFGFTEKHLFAIKTDWKSVFHLHETHILSQLENMLLYTMFLRFWKNKPLWFYRKMCVRDENWVKIRISTPWGPYYHV